MYKWEAHIGWILESAHFKYLYGKYDKSDRNEVNKNWENTSAMGTSSIAQLFIVGVRNYEKKKKQQPFVSVHNIHIQIIIERRPDRTTVGYTFKIILR